jgi:hypothetical protein
MLACKLSTRTDVPTLASVGQLFIVSVALMVSASVVACDVQCPSGTRLDGKYCRRIDGDSELTAAAGAGPASGAMSNPIVMNAAGQTADPNPTAAPARSSPVAGSNGMRVNAGAPPASAPVNVEASGHAALDAGSSQRGIDGAGGMPGSGGSGSSGCEINVCASDYPCLPLGADYTCRGQFADWPPAYSSSAFTANSDGTIKDSRSGLVWQATVAPSYAPQCSEEYNSSSGTAGDACNWQHAKDYCVALSLAAGGWRLPTKAELESLVDDSRTSPPIDPKFLGTPAENFLSS